MTLLTILKYKNFIDPSWVPSYESEARKKKIKINDIEVEPSEELEKTSFDQNVLKQHLKTIKEKVDNPDNLEKLEAHHQELVQKEKDLEEEELNIILILLS